VCGERLALTRLSCGDCETELSGVFEACEFCSLDAEDRDMLRVFLRSRGNMKDLERHLGVSYPTARARFDKLLQRLDLEPDDEEPSDTLTMLEQLSRGEIDVDDAIEQLGENGGFRDAGRPG
jgi:hypothetical protein